MESRAVSMMFLFMIIWIASPTSCSRLGFSKVTNSLGENDYAFDFGEVANSDSFNNNEYGDLVADDFYSDFANGRANNDIQAFPEHWKATSTFSVMSYGAVGNGKDDDTQAFLKAWGDVCGSIEGNPALIIPDGKTFLLKNVVFQGPCRARSLNFQLRGNLVAPNDMNSLTDKSAWVQFQNVKGLIINGGGQIDGQGAVWWRSCASSSCQRPTALHFANCNDLRLNDITHIDSARNHIGIVGCDGVKISDIVIRAPEDSPNTDGIDIASSSNINIRNSFIGTGDDCVAINTGSSHINITGVLCGPGHGISVGSLGKGGSYDTVEYVQVSNCTFKGTMNGARVKTWHGGSGYARYITFEDITMEASLNPIIIDQKYVGLANLLDQNFVQVSDVTYRNVRGTSADETAITLDCSDAGGCTNIVMDNIAITSSIAGRTTSAYCKNVQGLSSLTSPSVPCLSTRL